MKSLRGDSERPFAFTLAIAFLPLDLITFPWFGFSLAPISYLLGAMAVALQATPSCGKAKILLAAVIAVLFATAPALPLLLLYGINASRNVADLAPLFLARAVEFVVALLVGWGVLIWLKTRRLPREAT
jgi:hypothetical protein